MNFNQEDIQQIKLAAVLHDIGKIGISDSILNKNGKLDTGEWDEMKKHSEIGYRILSTVSEFSEIAEYVLRHQERWDGMGYPDNLKGEEIPVQARIIAIADAFDAMTVKRSYRDAMSEVEAVAEIKKYAGTQFDPEIARIFVEKVINLPW
jgi:HD-GYP domain-containing protein (c-di-GMP phosphodiesterase class II)